MTTATTAAPWQAQIVQQLEQKTADELRDKTHAIISRPTDAAAELLTLAATEAEALVDVEDYAFRTPGGEITAVTLSSLQDWIAEHNDELLPIAGSDDEQVGEATGDPREGIEVPLGESATLTAEGDEAEVVAGTTSGPDTDKGKLFDVKVKLDPTRPTVLKLAFSGGIDLDINDPADVAFYNRLIAGKTVALELEAHVAGAKKTHRRDSEGTVDAVVETKSLIIHSADTE